MGRARLLEPTVVDALYHLSARDCWYGQVHEVHYVIWTIIKQHGTVAADSSNITMVATWSLHIVQRNSEFWVFAPCSNCFTNVALWPLLRHQTHVVRILPLMNFHTHLFHIPEGSKDLLSFIFFKRDFVFLHIFFHISPMSDPQTDPVP